MRYVIYDKAGKILRVVGCPPEYVNSQVKKGENVLEAPKGIGPDYDITHKIVKGKLVSKSSAEIEAEKIPEIPESKRLAYVTNEQWQDVLNRLKILEIKAS